MILLEMSVKASQSVRMALFYTQLKRVISLANGRKENQNQWRE